MDFRRPGTRALKRGRRRPWPQAMPEQVRVLREVLAAQSSLVSAEALSRRFICARADRVSEPLQPLVTLGHTRETGDGRYIGA